ncbi:MAG: hypothetical protein FWD52_03235 [Candidatus Bathyarchaeota archaeon]|nr:hypothetical protein [Candidatus Termiticorpusculum sp.]
MTGLLFDDVYLTLAVKFGIQDRNDTIEVDVEKWCSRNVSRAITLIHNWTGKNLSKEELRSQINAVKNMCLAKKFFELIIWLRSSDNYICSIFSLSNARANNFRIARNLCGKDQNLNTNHNLISHLEGMFKYVSYT